MMHRMQSIDRTTLPTLAWLAGLVLCGFVLAARPGLGAEPAPRVVGYPARTMGTYAGISIVTADSAASEADANAARLTFQRVDSLMSNWTTTSEVARINRTAFPGPTRVHPEVAMVIDAALRVGKESDGAFDITVEPLVRAWGFLGGTPHVPAKREIKTAFAHVGADKIRFDADASDIRFTEDGVRIDLGGIAKGYAVDAAVQVLRAHHVENALVDISGNMFAMGAPPGAERWRIGIRDPRDRMPYFARLMLGNRAVATSGKYEQFVSADGKTYGHIIDPRDGRPAEGLISVTVVAPSAMLADAWGTALFVLGPRAAKRLLQSRDDLAAVLVEPVEGGPDIVWVESSLRPWFEIEPNTESMFRVEFF